MADPQAPAGLNPTPEQRRVAAGQFERANQVIATGNYDYGIQLLLTCCKLDPANLTYRRTLRQTEKNKYKNNLRGSALALVTTSKAKARLKVAARAGDFLRVLEHGEEVLVRNPWDTGTQLAMSEAADGMGLLDMAVWILDQARHKNPKDPAVNRAMARLLERRGNFAHALALWEMVRAALPNDPEAKNKAADLAASDTIVRGHYEAVVGKSQADDETEGEAKAPPIATPRPGASGADRVNQEAARWRAQIEKDPTQPAAYLNLAGVHRKAGKLEEARAVLEEGIGPTGRDFGLGIELADVMIEPFRRDLAIAEERLRDRADDAELRAHRARLAREVNSRELDLYRQKADHYPTDKASRFELGVRLYRAGQFDEAIRELQGIRSEPRYQWRVLLYLGHCFLGRNNWRLAERNFEGALKHLPAGETDAHKELLFELANGSAKAGDFAQAVERGYELANLDFAYRDVGRLLDDWQARLQRADVSG
jgi:tetratricopeptide (TPR) repeat protein